MRTEIEHCYKMTVVQYEYYFVVLPHASFSDLFMFSQIQIFLPHPLYFEPP